MTSILLFTIPASLIDWVTLIGGIIAIIGGLFGFIAIVFSKLLPWYRTRRDRTSLQKGLSADLFPPGIIERSTQYYIEPDCQSIDPAGSEEPRLTLAAKQKLFSFMDNALKDQTQHRYIILLADTGMGKSSFLLNYYARHLQHSHRKYEIALFPLGIPDVDKRISGIRDAANTVLFLDALDEDTLAIVDHAERLRNISELTQNFKKILITCRTQFFPKDEEIPRETGIVKIGPRDAGEGAIHLFHKLYLSPFSDEQVEKYVRQRYPFWQQKKRQKIRELVRKIPNLVVRPMLLSYVDELLLDRGEEIHYSFELYEMMVEAWLLREEGVFEDIKKEPLRKFSEQLAVNLYMNRERRHAEHITREEIVHLAREWKIPLDDWKLTGRSLLNRDAVGNYKFAHRSIMEYLFVKKFIQGDKACIQVEWTDQMRLFLKEIIEFHIKKREPIPFDIIGVKNFFLRYRSIPINNLQEHECSDILQKYGLFDTIYNKNGRGIKHLYEVKEIAGQKIVIDYTTGLMWQQAGSHEHMMFQDAKEYVAQLNSKGFAGYSDWRFPNLEEAMSLMEPEKNSDGFYIDSIFDQRQGWLWTSDLYSASRAWVVDFSCGSCGDVVFYDFFCVRAIRWGQSSII